MALRVNRRYTLKSLVGQGGMGEVYRVEDRLRPGVPLTLKVLRAGSPEGEALPEDAAVAALQREYLALAALSHPGLPWAQGYGRVVLVEGVSPDLAPPALGQPFVLRDYLPGAPLMRAAEGASVPMKLEWLLLLAQVLAYLHDQGLLYRDLSPDNVLVRRGAAVGQAALSLLDLGLVVPIGHGSDRSGTAKYLAPEVLRGEEATVRSEIYAFGVLAYELLAGVHPFPEAYDTLSLVRAHLRRMVGPLLALPKPLSDLLLKVMDKDPESRPATVAEMIPTLEEALATLGETLPHARRRGEPRTVGQGAVRQGLLAQLLAREGVDDAAAARWLPEWGEDVGEGPAEAALTRGVSILTGVVGAGCSRILRELEARARVLGFRVFTTSPPTAAPGHAAGPGWMSLFRGVLDGRRTDTQTPYLPLLKSVLLHGRNAVSPELLQEQAWERLLAGGEALLAEEAKAGPLLLIFDDLHRADHDTLAWFERLTERLDRRGVALVGASWPPGPTAQGIASLQARLRSASDVAWIPLPGLGAAEVACLAQRLLGERPDEALAESLRAHTDGNPLFLGELIRGAGDLGGIEALLASGHLPGAMEDASRAQLGRLDDAARGALEGLAVLGRSSTPEELGSLLGWDVPAAHDALHRASLAYLVRSEGGRYVFVNGMLAQICEESQTPARRARLHRRAAEMLREVSAEPLVLQRQARHWRLGGALDLALEDLWQGARLAEGRFMTRLARILYGEAQEIVAEGGSLPGLSPDRLSWEARARLAHLALWSGEYAEAEALAQGLLERQAPADLPRDSADGPAALFALLGQVSTRQGDYDLAVERFDRALAASTDDIGAAEILDHLSEVRFRRGDNEGGEEAARAALQHLGEAVAPALRASVVAHLGQAAQARSAFPEALEYYQRSFSRYSEVAHIRGMAEALGATAHIYELQDKIQEAVKAQEESLDLREEVGDVEGTAATLLRLGLNQYMLGDAAQGVTHLERSLSLYRHLQNPQGIGRALNALGVLHHVRGAYEDALSTRREAALHQERLGDRIGKAMSLANLAILYLEVGALAQAEATISEALAIVGEGGQRVRLARCQHILGMVALQRGRNEAARDQLNLAAETFEAMGLAEALSGVLVGLAQERLEARDLVEARTLADRSLELARSLSQPSILQAQVARARVLLAEVDLELGEVIPCLEEAHGIATQLNYADFLWQVFELKGRLTFRQGRPMEACRWLSQAMDVVYACHQQLPPELKETYVSDPRRQVIRSAMELALRQAGRGRVTRGAGMRAAPPLARMGEGERREPPGG